MKAMRNAIKQLQGTRASSHERLIPGLLYAIPTDPARNYTQTVGTWRILQTGPVLGQSEQLSQPRRRLRLAIELRRVNRRWSVAAWCPVAPRVALVPLLDPTHPLPAQRQHRRWRQCGGTNSCGVAGPGLDGAAYR
jgi:hypothetical protein